MTLDGFLTILTIVLAAYAVMPTVARLRIALHRAWLACISIIGLVLVLYFELFSLLGATCPRMVGTWCNLLTFTPNGPINPQQAAFLVVGVWLALASIKMMRTKLSPGSLPVLSRLVSELASQQRFADLVELITPQLSLLDKSA